MKKEETVFTLFILGVVTTMVVLTFGYRSGARLVPLLVGLVTLGLMLFISLMALVPGLAEWYRQMEGKPERVPKKKDRHSSEKERQTAADAVRQRERAVIGWLLFLTGAIYFLGFLVAIPLFLLLFLKLWARESWKLSLWISGSVVGITYFLFIYILRVPLHRGVLFG